MKNLAHNPTLLARNYRVDEERHKAAANRLRRNWKGRAAPIVRIPLAVTATQPSSASFETKPPFLQSSRYRLRNRAVSSTSRCLARKIGRPAQLEIERNWQRVRGFERDLSWGISFIEVWSQGRRFFARRQQSGLGPLATSRTSPTRCAMKRSM